MLAVLLLWPSAVSADSLNLASAFGDQDLEVIPGTQTYGSIYFYNVDGDKTTYITMETVDVPDGWAVEFLPALNTIQVSLGGPNIDVTQNIYVQQGIVYPTSDIEAPAGFDVIAIPDKLGEGIPGYVLAKELKVMITAPEGVDVGGSYSVTVNATAKYLGQTGAAIIGLERPFTFDVATVYELTEERVITPFDWGKWLPAILAGGIGIAVLGIIYVPKLIAKRRKSA